MQCFFAGLGCLRTLINVFDSKSMEHNFWPISLHLSMPNSLYLNCWLVTIPHYKVFGFFLYLLREVMVLNHLILLFLLLLSPAFPSSLPHGLSKGSSLSVENHVDYLTSPNGVFTAGFHLVGVNAYCFAIWFTKLGLNQTTLVWMANRDNPVNGKLSKLTLRRDGNLILTDADQFISWETRTTSSSSAQLFLQNNGNLVVMAKVDNINNILWQSLDNPTDTLLPEQHLTRHKRLISSRSQSNYSSGFYRLFFDDDNVLRLVFDGPETSNIYWPSPRLLPSQANRTIYGDSRVAALDFLGDFVSSDGARIRADDFGHGIQRRLTLDFDGNVRVYSLDKKRGIWIASGQAISDSCEIPGACGPNSLCIHNHATGRKCYCVHGFKMKNYAERSYGCQPEFNLSCKSSEVSVTFLKLPNTDFYGYDFRILRNATLEECERRCFQSCQCKGFQHSFKEDRGVYDCFLKRSLRDGTNSPESNGVIHVKLPKSIMLTANQLIKDFSLDCSTENSKLLSRNYRKGHDSSRILLLFASALGGLEMIGIISIWLFLRRSLGDSNRTDENYIRVAIGFRKFSYSELKKATRNFTEEIGRGSSGIVYKGTLCDNRVAAIKRLNEANPNEEEMLAELSIIGRMNHMNLIDVWGYCAEGKNRLLVYEYMEQGTLAENLNSSRIDWEKRIEIATGTAKGLAYLHEECLEWVLHCDVKPQNILLDSDYQPKVADFGLSKLLKRAGNNDSNFSRIRGTRGYMAPEWIFNLPITSKVDVYSYGIVVLELITGRSPMGGCTNRNGDQLEQRWLVKWVREKMQEEVEGKCEEIQEIIDPSMEEHFDMCKVKKLVKLALQCADEDKDERPTMSQVVDMLLQMEMCS